MSYKAPANNVKKPLGLVFVASAIVLIGCGAWIVGKPMLRHWLGYGPPAATLMLSGNIEAHESVLSFKSVQSRIVELPFDEGQWLRKDTLIAKVDDEDYRQQVVIAEAAVATQKQQLETARNNEQAAEKTVASDEADLRYKTLDQQRIAQLASQGYVSTDSRDLANAALQQSQAILQRDHALLLTATSNIGLANATVHDAEEALRLAQITESYTVLKAPIDGVILVRQSELGEVVAPGTPIVTLADIDHVWLRAYVNETDIGRIRLGEVVTVTTDNYRGRHYPGRISFISDKAEFTPKSVETHEERVTLVYRIRIDLDNPAHELVPGMPADAEVPLLPPGPMAANATATVTAPP